jgi:hypothetical protein
MREASSADQLRNQMASFSREGGQRQLSSPPATGRRKQVMLTAAMCHQRKSRVVHAAADAWLPAVGHPEHRAASCGKWKNATPFTNPGEIILDTGMSRHARVSLPQNGPYRAVSYRMLASPADARLSTSQDQLTVCVYWHLVQCANKDL